MNLSSLLSLWAAITAASTSGLPFRFTWTTKGQRFVAEGTVTRASAPPKDGKP